MGNKGRPMTPKHIQSLGPLSSSASSWEENQAIQVNSSPARSVFHDLKKCKIKKTYLLVSFCLCSPFAPLSKLLTITLAGIGPQRKLSWEMRHKLHSWMNVCTIEQRAVSQPKKLIPSISNTEEVKAMMGHGVWIKAKISGFKTEMGARQKKGHSTKRQLRLHLKLKSHPQAKTKCWTSSPHLDSSKSQRCHKNHSDCYIGNKHLETA